MAINLLKKPTVAELEQAVTSATSFETYVKVVKDWHKRNDAFKQRILELTKINDLKRQEEAQ